MSEAGDGTDPARVGVEERPPPTDGVGWRPFSKVLSCPGCLGPGPVPGGCLCVGSGLQSCWQRQQG